MEQRPFAALRLSECCLIIQTIAVSRKGISILCGHRLHTSQRVKFMSCSSDLDNTTQKSQTTTSVSGFAPYGFYFSQSRDITIARKRSGSTHVKIIPQTVLQLDLFYVQQNGMFHTNPWISHVELLARILPMVSWDTSVLEIPEVFSS